ncbi:hypothetical protein GCM10023329_57640 [Streptomyces sanyensis]|uniref:Peptidase M11 gametolysin domain-containing protein n=1 Tax=Streptomyces sanyensis TaxID=568869 RepID=A0ABP9BKV0_9ACTN
MGLSLKRIAGTAAASAALFAGTGAAASPAAADDAAKNRVLVVMLDVQDRVHADPGATKADFAARYFGADNSLKSYYDKVSRGRVDFVPAVPEKVIGPFKLSVSGGTCQPGEIRVKTEALMAAKGFKRGEDYDSLSMVTPRIGCSWSGLATIGRGVSWIQAPRGTANLGVIVHEFGHNQGYPHQPGLVCKDGNLTDCAEGRGGKSPMGGGGTRLGLTATQLIRSGWLDAAEHQRVKDSGTFTLRPLYGEQQGVRALEVPLGEDKVVLEYRRPTAGLDEELGGVYAYRVTKDHYAGGRQIRLGSNDGDGAVTTFTDTAHRLKVSVTSTGADGAEVAISMNGKAAPPAEKTTPVVTEEVEPTPPPTPSDDAPVVHGDDEPPADDAHGDDAAGSPGASADGAGTGTAGAPGSSSEDGTHSMDSGSDQTRLAATGSDATVLVLVSVSAALMLVLGALGLKRTRRNRAHP